MNAEALLLGIEALQAEDVDTCYLYWKQEDAERCSAEYRKKMIDLIEDALIKAGREAIVDLG